MKKTSGTEKKIDWTYGYWCDRFGHSYWGIQLAGTIEIGETLHYLPSSVKKNLLSWRFKENG